MVLLLIAGRGPLNDSPQSEGFLQACDQLVAKTSTWQHTTHNRQRSMSPAGLEPVLSAGERPQTALDGAANGIGQSNVYLRELLQVVVKINLVQTW